MKIHYDDPRERIACGAVYDWRDVGTGVTNIPRWCTCPECKSTPMFQAALARDNEIVEIRMSREMLEFLIEEISDLLDEYPRNVGLQNILTTLKESEAP